MKLKNKKKEILAQITERDNEGVRHNDPARPLSVHVGVFQADFR